MLGCTLHGAPCMFAGQHCADAPNVPLLSSRKHFDWRSATPARQTAKSSARLSAKLHGPSTATSSDQGTPVLAELIFPTATRVGGILVGVLLSLALSVLLWPKSASQEALR